MSKSHPKVKAPTDKPTGPSGVPGLSANTTGTKAAAARDDALTAIRQNYETVVAEQAVTVQAETAALDALRLRLEEAQAAIRDVHSVDVNLFPTTTPVNNSLRV